MTAKGPTPIQAQADKLFKHTRAGSYGTRARYRASCSRFLAFVHATYGTKNLRNLQDKHVAAFIRARKADGMTDKTIKNDLGAIRYLHDMVPDAKYDLAANHRLEQQYDVSLATEDRGDRAWTEEEYSRMRDDLADGGPETGRDVRDVLVLARTMGLRVAEAVAMHRSQAEHALRHGVYPVRGEAKNGKHRQVALSPQARDILTDRLKEVARGEKVFVRATEQTHQAINRMEQFIGRHRGRWTTEAGRESRDGQLTVHGLRYSYVQDRLAAERANGRTQTDAARRIAHEVGHDRTDVIAIYRVRG